MVVKKRVKFCSSCQWKDKQAKEQSKHTLFSWCHFTRGGTETEGLLDQPRKTSWIGDVFLIQENEAHLVVVSHDNTVNEVALEIHFRR